MNDSQMWSTFTKQWELKFLHKEESERWLQISEIPHCAIPQIPSQHWRLIRTSCCQHSLDCPICVCISMHAYVHCRNPCPCKRMILPDSCSHLCLFAVSCFFRHSTRLLVFLRSVSLLLTVFTPMVSFSLSPLSHITLVRMPWKPQSLWKLLPHINYPLSH